MPDTGDMTNPIDIGRRIRALRQQRKLTQVQLAAELGIGRSTLAGIENGRAFPGRATLEAVATFFGATLDALYEGSASEIGPERHHIVSEPEELALLALYRAVPQKMRRALLRNFALEALAEGVALASAVDLSHLLPPKQKK